MSNQKTFQEFNQWLVSKWKKLPNRAALACPYISVPTIEYEQSELKFVVVNRETNGWGEKEKFLDDANLVSNLISMVNKKISVDWENLGSVWPMYYALRCLSEGLNPEESYFVGKVGFHHTNVALIGKRYGENGYDDSILDLLVEACDNKFKLLDPGVILLSVGFGSVSHTESKYLEILEKTEFFGKLHKSTPLSNCPDLFRLEFENIINCDVYGCAHPQGLSYRHIVSELSRVIHIKLSTL